MNKITNPKIISDFAKEYKKTYISLVQCKSAYQITLQERDELQHNLKIASDFKDNLLADTKKYQFIMQRRQSKIIDFCVEHKYDDLLKLIEEDIVKQEEIN